MKHKLTPLLKGIWRQPESVWRYVVLVMVLSTMSTVSAQNLRTVTGTVVDEQDEPLIGATVRVIGNIKSGATTDLDGKFSLQAATGNTLEVSYVAYKPQRVKVTEQSSYDIKMVPSDQQLSEIVVVGYGTQKKATLTGAVSQLTSGEMQMTKSQDAKNMLTGKVPGVRVTQATSEPGDFSQGNFDIRGYGGSPLIVVDGVPRGNFERLDPNEIESISVLKDASAAIYGAQGGNGVVLITTKRGSEGRAKVTYSMYYGIQTPAEMLKPVGSIDRMTLYNEKSMRNLTMPTLTFDDAAFEAFYSGAKTSTDWYDAVMRNSAPQQQHTVGVSGGTSKIDYFVNFSYLDQKGFLKSDALDYNRYNVRSNVNAQINDYITIGAKLAGTIDERDRPFTETWSMFGTLWRCVPDESVYVNGNPAYIAKPTADINNPVALIDKDISGYRKNITKLFSSTFDLTLKVPHVKGLELKGKFSYDNTIQDNTVWQQEFNEYTYDAATDIYNPVKKNSPSKLNRGYNNQRSTLWQAAVNYDNKFGNHGVTGLLLYEESYSKGDDLSGSRYFTLQIPYMFAGNSENQSIGGGNVRELVRKAVVGRFTYAYASKYLAEFAFRYDGSSKFASGSQWGFFPSVQIGWRISEESFLKNIEWVNNLKIRASYGKMGDDSCADYQFITGFDYPNTSGNIYNNYPKGYVFDGQVVNALGFRSAANPNLTWYTIKTANVGVDADFWNGLLGVTAEVFQRDRSGLLATRIVSLPGTFGTTMPQENLNSDRTRGFELELRHRNRIGDFNYSVSGNMSLTRTQRRYVERTASGNSYANWMATNNTNRYNDIWMGWGANGRFETWHDMAYAPAYGKGNGSNISLPGDYIYEDWNGDGVIDDNDKHPIATTISKNGANQNYPLLNFGLTLSGDWHGIDCSFTFQGSGMSYVAYGDQLASPLGWNGNALDMFLDRWHPVDPKADPYNPDNSWYTGYYSYGGTTPDQNSEFAIQKGDYLRLKTAEIGYTFPQKWTKVVGVQNLRIYVNAYNLFTITNVKGLDPEKPSAMYGQMYPLNRTYNFGASVTF